MIREGLAEWIDVNEPKFPVKRSEGATLGSINDLCSRFEYGVEEAIRNLNYSTVSVQAKNYHLARAISRLADEIR